MGKYKYEIVRIDATESGNLESSGINPNVMDPEKEAILGKVIDQFGMLQPPLLQRKGQGYVILDGHHRIERAKGLGIDFAAVVLPEDADANDVKALRLALNNLRGRTDLTIASQMLSEMVESGVKREDLFLTGFLDAEVAELLKSRAAAVQEVDVVDGVIPDVHDVDEAHQLDAEAKKVFDLVISFATAKERTAARRLLLRASGASKDVNVGFRKLVGMDDDGPKRGKRKKETTTT